MPIWERPEEKHCSFAPRCAQATSGLSRTVCFPFSKLTEKCLRWRRTSLGRSSSSSESWCALCGNLCGGDCSHLLERRYGSEFSQQCLDLSVLCRIRPFCTTKMTPGSGLWSRRTPRPLPCRAGASSTSRAYPSPRCAAGGRFAGSFLGITASSIVLSFLRSDATLLVRRWTAFAYAFHNVLHFAVNFGEAFGVHP